MSARPLRGLRLPVPNRPRPGRTGQFGVPAQLLDSEIALRVAALERPD